ncbi:RING-6 protein [Paraphoma chrysanthemicola]|nr:RING-6 protein [Paraphoma chrysanthemicola]
MTKKRKRYPDLNQKLERPWCYYCERDFDDLKILISHQKAKHFKCDRCGRRLNTAGGLSVHMNQVHKENLTHVENANPGRQGLEIEIFGMEGVPAEIIDQHNQQVTQAHFAEEAERARLTGNPIRGAYTNGTAPPNKRAKVTETLEEIEQRADKYRTDRKNGVLPLPPAVAEVVTDPTPPAVQNPYSAPPAYPPQGFPGQPAPFSPTNGAAPARPGSVPGQGGALPPRPGFGAPPDAIQSSIDDLIAGVQREVPEKKEDKKSKKEKNMRLIYNDDIISPEEKMATLPRFAEFVRT